MDELIDIVDQDNHVVGQELKSIAHQKGLLHRIIIAELIDSKGNWILVRQANDRQDPGQFVSPVGGHIQAGESEVDALNRETLEEVGITNFEYKRVGQSVFNRFVNQRQENHLFIVYEIYSDQIPVLNHESVEYKKFTKAELINAFRDNPENFGAAFHFVRNTFYK